MDKITLRIRLKFPGRKRPPAKEILKAIHRIPFDKMILEQAKRRIDKGGDSEIRYRRLWADTFKSRGGGTSFRAGGKPLLDTRLHVYHTLNTVTRRTSYGMQIVLRGSAAAVYHHHGFRTHGPNFIPLTTHARRMHRAGADPRLEGLIKGQDYIMAWHGVHVPARPIFRMAPEDRRDLVKTVEIALRKRFKPKKRRAA